MVFLTAQKRDSNRWEKGFVSMIAGSASQLDCTWHMHSITSQSMTWLRLTALLTEDSENLLVLHILIIAQPCNHHQHYSESSAFLRLQVQDISLSD